VFFDYFNSEPNFILSLVIIKYRHQTEGQYKFRTSPCCYSIFHMNIILTNVAYSSRSIILQPRGALT